MHTQIQNHHQGKEFDKIFGHLFKARDLKIIVSSHHVDIATSRAAETHGKTTALFAQLGIE